MLVYFLKGGSGMIKQTVIENRIDTEYPIFLFHQGTLYHAYKILGCHKEKMAGKEGHVFRVWAPHAKKVYLTGEFCDWDTSFEMNKISENGVWEIFVSGIREYDSYKYIIETYDGRKIFKADPYAVHMETRPATASKVYNIEGFKWTDDKYLKSRTEKNHIESPMNIYEVHLGSWKKNADGSFYSYSQLADELVPYVKEMGYTHIELMPVSEYPFDGSWGYQVIGYYAATSRYGTPKELMAFIDRCHSEDIGVIIDWVPGHFPRDAAGLYEFDGESCYEYSDLLKREHKEWGTMVFDYGRNEVRSFLISNAVFWMDMFHADGLRVDAVASMLYLDYNRADTGYRPNIHGGTGNLEAMAFLRDMNNAVKRYFPGTIVIAEESTAWPKVTRPAEEDGLGFDFKWNMGWMNDTLSYMKQDPFFKKGWHNKMNFSLTYAFSEHFILPLSHDEVVHMKGSLINKMPGGYDDKFANLRAYFGYMIAHPGKKLTFMGSELAQFSEWNYASQLDWNLLAYNKHKHFHTFIKELNHFYKRTSQLWELDGCWDGFRWINADDSDNNILSFRRFNKKGEEIMVISNFSPVYHEKYTIIQEGNAEYSLVFSTSDVKYKNESVSTEVEVPGFSTSFWLKK